MKFLDVFPLPKIISIPAAGFDISDESIKHIEFEKNKDKLKIKNYGEKNLPPDIIVNGEIKNENALSDFLSKNYKNSGIKNIIVSLPEEKAFIDIIELPRIETKNIKQALNVQIENYFPLKRGNAVFDYEILDYPDSGTIDAVVAAFPSELILSYKNILDKAGLYPLSFELESEALIRSLMSEKSDDFKMIIDFGKTRTSITIIFENKIFFTTTIKIGGKDIDRAISRSLSLSADEAEKTKKQIAISPQKSGTEKDKTDGKLAVLQTIMPVLYTLSQEIKKYTEYWSTHYGHKHKKNRETEIKEIILCGGDANLPGLAEFLSEKLNIPVKLANVWINVFNFDDYIPEIKFNASLKFATAIGLALRPAEMKWI